MQARFYQFAKRENSTKKPDTPASTLTILFKDDTEILNPLIEVHAAGAFHFNYCYIEFTARYYWVRSADSIAQNTYLLHFECDVLASHIDAVRGQSVYANYTSYAYDEFLDDGRIMTGDEVTTEYSTRYTPAIFNPVTIDVDHNPRIQLTYCIGAITDHGYLHGIDIFYGDRQSALEIAMRFSDFNFWENLKWGSPWDAICESYVIPFNVANCHSVDTIYYANVWDIPMNAKKVIKDANPTYSDVSIVVPLPTNRDFRFSEKFVKYYLNIPYCGVVTLPTALLYAEWKQNGQATVYVRYSGDCITGQFSVSVRIGKVPVGIYGATLKSNFALGGRQTQASLISTNSAIGAVGGATAAMAGGAAIFSGAVLAAGAVGAAGGLIKGAIDIPPVHSFGSFSGGLALPAMREADGDLYVVKTEADSHINPATLTAIAGRPTEKIVTITDGYIQTSGASVAFAGTSDEIRQFNNLLNGGIYVE